MSSQRGGPGIETNGWPRGPVTDDRLSVSLTSTGPDGVVVEIQVSAPQGAAQEALRTRLEVTIRHVLDVLERGEPIDVALDDVWISARMLG